MVSNSTGPDERAKRTWSLGSYSDIATDLLPMAAHLVESVDAGPDDSVLDVACGTGNVAITAARRGATVTGLDFVPGMLEEAKDNEKLADVESIDWQEGSATHLPFEDGAFDVTLSSVGHVFAVPADAAGRELVRVTRPGGRIAFTSWTPDGVVPAMGAVMNDYLPENPDAPDPPFLWGDPDVVEARMGDAVDDLAFETETVTTPVLSPRHYLEKAMTESGMFIVALESVDESDVPALREELLVVIGEHFDESRNVVQMEYRLATMLAE